MNAPALSLADRWKELTQEEPRLRIRDAAARLGVSEAELLGTRPASEITRLQPRWKDLIEEIATIGDVMSLVRNDYVVIEKEGPFEELEFDGPVGVTLGDYMDLRIFWSHWNVGYAVVNKTPDRTLRSFQVFDKHGDAVIKIYAKQDAQIEAFDRIVAQFKTDEAPQAEFAPVPPKTLPKPAPAGFDEAAWKAEWLDLQDTHDFYPMLMKHRIDRVTSLRHAPEGYAWRVKNSALDFILEQARDRKMDIMVFVGSRGVIEIHTGPVENIKVVGDYLNVLDPDFNLHFLPHGISEAWVVIKPTVDGDVTAVEFYQEDGKEIAMFFGRRKPGEPELETWRQLVRELPRYEG